MQSVVVVAEVAVGAVHMGLGSLLRMAVAVLVRRFMGMVMPMIVFSGVVMVVIMCICVAMVMSLVLTVPMRMSARTVGPAFRFKRFIDLMHDQMHGPQHVGQHMIGLYLQVVGLEFYRHMAVAEVIGSARQIKRRTVVAAVRDAQHRLRCGQHPDHGTVFGDQHITAAHQRAARQKNAELPTQGVGRVEAAFLAHVPVEFDSGCTFDEDGGKACAARNNFGNLNHVQP